MNWSYFLETLRWFYISIDKFVGVSLRISYLLVCSFVISSWIWVEEFIFSRKFERVFWGFWENQDHCCASKKKEKVLKTRFYSSCKNININHWTTCFLKGATADPTSLITSWATPNSFKLATACPTTVSKCVSLTFKFLWTVVKSLPVYLKRL